MRFGLNGSIVFLFRKLGKLHDLGQWLVEIDSWSQLGIFALDSWNSWKIAQWFFSKETHLKNPPQTHDFCFKMFGFPGSKKHELVRIEGRPAIFEASGFLVETSGSRARHRGIYPKFRSHLARWAPTSCTYRSPITAGGRPPYTK